MKCFITSQIQEIDRLTIDSEPISSINLMERAADVICCWFARNINSNKKTIVFAGPGNNGGDGLALARMLIEIGYIVDVYFIDSSSISSNCQVNLTRLKAQGVVEPQIIKNEDDFPVIDRNSVIVDSLFGSGLTRALSGIYSKLINFINQSGATIISIDMPSGLFGEQNPYPNTNSVVRATTTLTLQFPKLSFLFSENSQYVGEFKVLPIGLHPDAINSIPTQYNWSDLDSIRAFVKVRGPFSHKGNFGHCLIIAGSKGMMGAAVLASSSCVKAGSGLVTAHVPRIGYSILQQSIPEVMVDVDADNHYFTFINSVSKYDAFAIGPGLGKSQKTSEALAQLLIEIRSPLIIDADGLNIIAENSALLNTIPSMTVITPHPGEFDRLFGKSNSGYERLAKAVENARKYNIVIVLKGAFTQIVCPDGKVYFNSTGNPGMATAGSGDALTGIIASFLGQGYNPIESSILGVYIHGLAGDLTAQEIGMDSITASDIISHISNAFNIINTIKNE